MKPSVCLSPSLQTPLIPWVLLDLLGLDAAGHDWAAELTELSKCLWFSQKPSEAIKFSFYG